MTDLKIVPKASPADIPTSLRRLADQIEAGEHEGLRFVVVVAVDDNTRFATYGYGKMSTLEAIGALARAGAGDMVDE